MNLFDHEMIGAALIDLVNIPVNFCRLSGDRHILKGCDVNVVSSCRDDVAIVQEDYLLGMVYYGADV